MTAGGVLLVCLGTWVIAQVTVGQALERLGIIKDPNEGGD